MSFHKGFEKVGALASTPTMWHKIRQIPHGVRVLGDKIRSSVLKPVGKHLHEYRRDYLTGAGAAGTLGTALGIHNLRKGKEKE